MLGLVPAVDHQFTAKDWITRGIAKGKAGDADGAIADYTEAIRLNPNAASAFYNRAVARQAKGDRRGATADFTQAKRLNAGVKETS